MAFQPNAFQGDAFQTDGQAQPGALKETLSTSDQIAHSVVPQTSGLIRVHAAEIVAPALQAPPALRTLADSVETTDFIDHSAGEEGLRTLTDEVSTSDEVVAIAPPQDREAEAGETIPTSDYALVSTTAAEDVYGDIPTGWLPALTSPVGAGDTELEVSSPPSTFTDPFVIVVVDEQMLVTGVSGNTLTVERAYNGTTATGHSSGISVKPAQVSITVNGVGIAAFVDFRASRFSTRAANANPGQCEIRVKDVNRALGFTVGHEIVVRFRGVRVWGGYVVGIKREYAFAGGTGQTLQPRYLIIEGVDYNILLKRRIFYDKADPTNMAVRKWKNGTADSSVIGEVVSNHLDLFNDGLSFDIRHVGTPALPTTSCNPDAPDHFRAGSGGWTWGDVMAALTHQTGAVYYIDPDKVFRHVDDSTKQSRFGFDGLSDSPSGSLIGYRDAEIDFDGTKLTNDMYVWGIGQGAPHAVLGRSSSAQSIAEHGLWQQAELRLDMYCQESVEKRAQTWVAGSPQNRRGHKDDKVSVRATVFVPYFRVADVITFESTTFGVSDTMPVRAAEITFPTPWDIQCVLAVGHEIDQPWSTFEFLFPQLDMEFGGVDPWEGLPGLTDPPWNLIFPPVEPWDPCIDGGGGGGGGDGVDCTIDEFEEPKGPYPVATAINDFDIGSPRWFQTFATQAGTQSGTVEVVDGHLSVKLSAGSAQAGASVLVANAPEVYEVEVAFAFTHIPLIPYLGDGETEMNTANRIFLEVVASPALYSRVVISRTYRNGQFQPHWVGPDGEEYPFNPVANATYRLKLQYDSVTGTSRAKLWNGPNEPGWMASQQVGIVDPNTLQLQPIFIQHSAGNGDQGDEHDYLYGWRIYYVRDNACADPCAGIEPGELADPQVGVGPVTGEFPLRQAQTDGSTYLFTKHQFQPDSSEVWVDGMRLRLGFDYQEYPRSRTIHLGDHIDVGGSEAMDPPKVIIVNYVIWTIDHPAPTQEPV